jgi:hypothetical protein
LSMRKKIFFLALSLDARCWLSKSSDPFPCSKQYYMFVCLTIHQTKYSRWNINNCGAVTLGQEKRYMHISVHTLTHIYMRGSSSRSAK